MSLFLLAQAKRHRKSVPAKEMCQKRRVQEKILGKRDIYRNRKRENMGPFIGLFCKRDLQFKGAC